MPTFNTFHMNLVHRFIFSDSVYYYWIIFWNPKNPSNSLTFLTVVMSRPGLWYTTVSIYMSIYIDKAYRDLMDIQREPWKSNHLKLCLIATFPKYVMLVKGVYKRIKNVRRTTGSKGCELFCCCHLNFSKQPLIITFSKKIAAWPTFLIPLKIFKVKIKSSLEMCQSSLMWRKGKAGYPDQ